MSRLDDLIELIRTTNEVYFITAPKRVRTVFILADDIAELALKSYLQTQAQSRQVAFISDLRNGGIVKTNGQRNKVEDYLEGKRSLVDLYTNLDLASQQQKDDFDTRLANANLPHWTIKEADDPIRFHQVTGEVKDLFPASHAINSLLDNIQDRHLTRNQFFHNPDRLSLTIDDEDCLRALCDLFLVLEYLFPKFLPEVQADNTVGCQIGVLRLKLAACRASEVAEPYNATLKQLQKGYRLKQGMYEHSILHSVSETFFDALCNSFDNSIARLETRITSITDKPSISATNQIKLSSARRTAEILRDQLTRIQSLR